MKKSFLVKLGDACYALSKWIEDCVMALYGWELARLGVSLEESDSGPSCWDRFTAWKETIWQKLRKKPVRYNLPFMRFNPPRN